MILGQRNHKVKVEFLNWIKQRARWRMIRLNWILQVPTNEIHQ
jgi:hypothetical protein